MNPEIVNVGVYCLLFSIECSCVVLSMVTRDTLFLKLWDCSFIAPMTVVVAITSAIAAKVQFSIIQSLSNRKSSQFYAAILPSLSGCIIALFWVVFVVGNSASASLALYIWVDVYIQLMIQQFWEKCSAQFDVRQSKLYFGYITYGSTIGTLFTGAAFIPFLQHLGLATHHNLIIVAIELQMIAALMYFLCSTQNTIKTEPQTVYDQQEKRGTLAMLQKVKQGPYLQHICIFEIFASIVRVLIDFQTMRFLSKYPEDIMKASLGMINGVQSVLMIPLQILAPFIFTRFGVIAGIATLPLVASVFGAVTYVSQMNMLLIGCRGLYNGVTYTIYNTSRELLWLPLAKDERPEMKAFINGTVRSFARIIGAIISMILYALKTGDDDSSLSLLIVLLGVLWGMDALSSRRPYALHFYKALKRGIIYFDSPHVDILPDQVALVKEILQSGAINQVRYVLSALPAIKTKQFAQELRSVFFRKNSPLHIKVRILSLYADGLKKDEMDDTSIFSSSEIIVLMSNTSVDRIRCDTLLACSYERSENRRKKYGDAIKTLLQSQHCTKSVECCLAIALLRLTDWIDETAHIRLQKMIHDDEDETVQFECIKRIAKEAPELIGDGYIIYLLNKNSSQLRQAALNICKYRENPSDFILPALLRKLGNTHLRAHIVKALLNFNPSSVWGYLVPFLENAVQRQNDIGDAYSEIVGGIHLLGSHLFPIDPTIDLFLWILESLYYEDSTATKIETFTWNINSKACYLREQIAENVTKLPLKYHQIQRLLLILEKELHVAYELSHVLKLLCVDNDDTLRTSLLISHLDDTNISLNHIIMKLSSIYLSKNIHINLIIDGLQSGIEEQLTAIEEMLDNILPSDIKIPIMHRFFSKYSDTKRVQEMTLSAETTFEKFTASELLVSWISSENKVLVTLSRKNFSKAILRYVLSEEQAGSQDDVDSVSTLQMAALLRASPLFRKANIIELLENILHRLKKVKVASGDTFLIEGCTGAEVFIIYEGEVRLHRGGSVVVILSKGESIGEVCALNNCAKEYPFSATAITNCTLLQLSSIALEDIISHSATVSRGLLETVARGLRWENNCSVRSSSSQICLNKVALASGAKTVKKLNRSKSSPANMLECQLEMLQKHVSYVSSPVLSAPDRRETIGLLEKCLYLKGNELFKNLQDYQVGLVAELCNWKCYSPGEIVYEEGQAADHIWMVIDGCICISEKDNSTTYGPGESFGEMSFLRDAYYRGTAVVLQQFDALLINTQDLIELVIEHPTTLAHLIHWISKRVVNKDNLESMKPSTTTQSLGSRSRSVYSLKE